MQVSVNGTRMELEDPASVDRLLERLDLAGKPCAVEVNRTLVPRREHGHHRLCEGDEIEIVTLVGGG